MHINQSKVQLLGPIFEMEWSRRSNCVSVPNFVAIGPTIAEIWPYFDFSRWRSPLSWIFKFFEIFNDRTAQKGLNCVTVPNFVNIGQTEAEIWRFFKDGGRRHLEFVMCVFGPPTKGIWWSLSLCKIWLESMQ